MDKFSRKIKTDFIVKISVFLLASFGVIALTFMFAFVLKEAYPAYKEYGFFQMYFSANFSIAEKKYGMLGPLSITLISAFCATFLALPLAWRAAVFLFYRIKKGQRTIKILINILASVPSILFGIFALYSLKNFSNIFIGGKNGTTLFNGIIMLVFMIIPTLVSMIFNQLKTISPHLITNVIALGNSKTHAIYTVGKKEIKSGILVAVITAFGRAIGETIALSIILNAGAPKEYFSSGFWKTFTEGPFTLGILIAKNMFTDIAGSKNHLFAAGILLFIIVMILVGIINSINHNQRNKTSLFAPLILIRKRSQSVFLKTIREFLWWIFFPFYFLRWLVFFLFDRFQILWMYFKLLVTNFWLSIFSIKNKEETISNIYIKYARTYRQKFYDYLRWLLELLSIMILLSFTGWIFLSILIKGIPNWTSNDWKYTYFDEKSSKILNGDILNPLLFTFVLVAFTLLISFPISLFGAVYLSEYASNKKSGKIIKFFLDSLGGTPSILFGIFGMVFFIQTLNLRVASLNYSLIAGVLTMVLVVIPTFTRSIEQTLMRVPMSLRRASLALGASKTRTILKVVIPNSISGIVTGIILSAGRIIAETAPVYLTFGFLLVEGNLGMLFPGHTLTTNIYGNFWTSANFEYQKDMAYKLGAASLLLSTLITLAAECIEPLFKFKPFSKFYRKTKALFSRKYFKMIYDKTRKVENA